MLHITVLRHGHLEMQLAIMLGAMHWSSGGALPQSVYLRTFSAFSTLAVHFFFFKGREFGEVTTGSKGQWLAEVG